MNKTDKETLYNLLNISQSYLTGFKDDSIQIPNFTDDIKVSLQTENLNDNQNFQENNKPVSTGITLEILHEKIQKCDRCGLCRTRKQTVPGVGVSRPLVMVIGEGPGADEDEQGLHFTKERIG